MPTKGNTTYVSHCIGGAGAGRNNTLTLNAEQQCQCPEGTPFYTTLTVVSSPTTFVSSSLSAVFLTQYPSAVSPVSNLVYTCPLHRTNMEFTMVGDGFSAAAAWPFADSE